jgi:hypothetical protein
VLSRVSAGEPGRWRTTRTPFLREIMDCLSPSSRLCLQIGQSPPLLDACAERRHALCEYRLRILA